MNSISGIPWLEARFDENGAWLNPNDVRLPAGVTDLLVMSHGWNNSEADARTLYQKFFTSFAAVGRPGEPAGRKFAILGVIWPSKKFDELVAASKQPGGGAAGMGPARDPQGEQRLVGMIEGLKDLFGSDSQRRTLDEVKALVPELEDKGSARREFVEKIRSLLDPTAADGEDASATFFKDDGNELMKRLKIDADDLDPEVASSAGGATALPSGAGSAAEIGGAAGLKDFFSGFKASAFNVLNYSTYYTMKARAGTVGKNGVARVIDKLSPEVERIHLIGHSFGGRVVTAAAANSATAKIRSMSLLQTAFSHHGFSKIKGGFFRSVVDQKRIRGAIVVTHTPNDKAVGVAYPIASRLNGDTTAAFGDENDKFGGIGRNGAQQMEAGEVVKGGMQPANGDYSFAAGRFFNLESSAFIKDHSDVTGKEIARAVRAAVTLA